MSEIEKMKRYIELTKLDMRPSSPYQLNTPEAFELAYQAQTCDDFPLEAITLAFNYGKAKGYRAAKAEGKRVTA